MIAMLSLDAASSSGEETVSRVSAHELERALGAKAATASDLATVGDAAAASAAAALIAAILAWAIKRLRPCDMASSSRLTSAEPRAGRWTGDEEKERWCRRRCCVMSTRDIRWPVRDGARQLAVGVPGCCGDCGAVRLLPAACCAWASGVYRGCLWLPLLPATTPAGWSCRFHWGELCPARRECRDGEEDELVLSESRIDGPVSASGDESSSFMSALMTNVHLSLATFAALAVSLDDPDGDESDTARSGIGCVRMARSLQGLAVRGSSAR